MVRLADLIKGSRSGDDFRVTPWPRLRDTVVQACNNARPHSIHAVTEVDFTAARARLRELSRATRVAVSPHAFVMGCVARAAVEYPMLHAFRHGRKLVTFDAIDVCTVIDQHAGDALRTRLPVVCIVREADSKSIAQINWEIRSAARSDLGQNPDTAYRRRLTRWPAPVQKIMFRRLLRDPWLHRRFFGTLGFTSSQSPQYNYPLHAFVPNMQGATIAMGNIHRKFLPDAAGQPALRHVMDLSGVFDHDMVDGMAIARFTLTLVNLLTGCHGLDDEFIRETRELVTREKAQS